MPNSNVDTPGLNTLMLAVLATTAIYMIWVGVSGAPIPEWVYWISTIL